VWEEDIKDKTLIVMEVILETVSCSFTHYTGAEHKSEVLLPHIAYVTSRDVVLTNVLPRADPLF
jgi:hypothetical protein